MSINSTLSFGADHMLSRLSRAMQMVLLLLIFLFATLLYWVSTRFHSESARSFLTAIATGLLVSAAFGLAQALITNRVTAELLRASVVEEVRTSLHISAQEFYPTIDISASSTPNYDFNRLLMQDLKDSTTYWFRGISARYTAVRLSLNTNANLQANLVLPDLTQPYALDGRTSYAFRHDLYPGLSFDEIRKQTVDEVVLGIVGTVLARPRCFGIQLILTPDPALDRYEIFRNSVWITLYSDKGAGTVFPRTLRFSNDSVLYRAQEVECLHAKEHPASRIVDIPRNLSTPQTLDLLEQILGLTVTENEFHNRQSEFDRFAERFRRQINLGGGS